MHTTSLNLNNNSKALGFSSTLSRALLIVATALSALTTRGAQQATVKEGATVTFSVEANGTNPFSYQWKKNGAAISGATGSAYTIPNITPADAVSFSVVVSNSAGSTTSDVASLVVEVVKQAEVVEPAPTVAINPGSSSGNSSTGSETSLNVSAFGNSLVYGTQNFPLTAVAGSAVSFTYNVENRGTKAWGLKHSLALLDSQFKLVDFGDLNGTDIRGASAAEFNFVAPTVPGTYKYIVQPLEDGTEWFGSQVTLVLKVTAPEISALGNSMVYGATDFPLTVDAGSVVNFTYDVMNTGTKAWGSNHYLALLDSAFNLIDFSDLEGMDVGSRKTAGLTFKAPTTAGTYQYVVRPLENGVEWFGSQLTVTLKVKAPLVSALGNSMVYGATDFPLTVDAGSVVNFTYDVENTGTKAWGTSHYLALLDSSFKLINFGNLNGAVVGSRKTVGLTFTAPTTAGTYQYVVRPLENGVEWFGSQLTVTLTVKAPLVSALGNSMVYGATDFPLTVRAGSVVNFTYNVANTGTKAWGSNHYLALLDSSFKLINFGALNGTAAGAGKTMGLNFTAPTTAGTYEYVVQPLENGVEWFGSQVRLTVTVY